MADSSSFEDWRTRLAAGDQTAAAQVFNRFACRLIGLARSRLDRSLRAKVDPEDVVQSVFRDFFRGQAQRQLELESWESIWGLLTVITLRKCGRRMEHFRAGRRDVRRESASGSDSAPSFEAVAREPTPAEAAMLVETVHGLASELTELERRILMLALDGHEVAEIAASVGRTERTVQRVLKQVRDRLLEMRGTDA